MSMEKLEEYNQGFICSHFLVDQDVAMRKPLNSNNFATKFPWHGRSYWTE